jgi:hypothetical protein
MSAANAQAPQVPPTQRVLETDYSYVNVEVPFRSEEIPSDQSSTPHRPAIVARPVVLSYQRTTATANDDVEAGATSTGPAGTSSGGNKITTSDVANIFRASTTVQTVNTEQIERIEKSKYNNCLLK